MIIEEFWQAYKEKLVPKNASEYQIKIIQMAFYAGCMQIMSINEGLGQPGVSAEYGCMVLSAIHKELKEYRDKL